MTITRIAMFLMGLGVALFLVLFATTLATTLRRQETTGSGVGSAARLAWTLVPAALLALLLGSLYMTGRVAL